MPLKLKVGDVFPSLSLSDDRDNETSIEEVADGRPLIFAFYRGPW